MRFKVMLSIVTVMIMAGLSVFVVNGSSHNDAPLISDDPVANNTDVYAFVSTEEGRSDNVTLIANYVPLVEPGDGPTYKRFSDKVLYEIMVDTDGDAKEDVTYQFRFKNEVVNGNTVLYNFDKIGLPPNVSDPSSQYTNLNILQSYTLTEVRGDRRSNRLHQSVLLEDARVAPAHIGPRSTGTVEEYEELADAAIHSVSTDFGEMRVFVGPRDEGFFFDLIGTFDLLNFRDPGFDTFNGFNVYTIALEIPKSRFAGMGDGNNSDDYSRFGFRNRDNGHTDDGIIGVWASASRPKITLLRDNGRSPGTSGSTVQVSRLGSPVVNEALNPLSAKDLFNASEPKSDERNGIDDFLINPGDSQGQAALVPLINNATGCTPENGRIDLEAVFLTGINQSIADSLAEKVPSLEPFAEAGGNFTGTKHAEMLRLNYNVEPSASPSSLGLLGGDPAGYPNGRRVGDDVVDIALKGAGGGILHVLGAIDCPDSLELTDNVDGNDVPYLNEFPYLGTPHQGFEHNHSHGIPTTTALGVGSGLILGGIALGTVFTVRRRRSRSINS